MVRQGNIDNPPKTPLVPGFECSGIVESVGENTTGFEVCAEMFLMLIQDFQTANNSFYMANKMIASIYFLFCGHNKAPIQNASFFG